MKHRGGHGEDPCPELLILYCSRAGFNKSGLIYKFINKLRNVVINPECSHKSVLIIKYSGNLSAVLGVFYPIRFIHNVYTFSFVNNPDKTSIIRTKDQPMQ